MPPGERGACVVTARATSRSERRACDHGVQAGTMSASAPGNGDGRAATAGRRGCTSGARMQAHVECVHTCAWRLLRWHPEWRCRRGGGELEVCRGSHHRHHRSTSNRRATTPRTAAAHSQSHKGTPTRRHRHRPMLVRRTTDQTRHAHDHHHEHTQAFGRSPSASLLSRDTLTALSGDTHEVTDENSNRTATNTQRR